MEALSALRRHYKTIQMRGSVFLEVKVVNVCRTQSGPTGKNEGPVDLVWV